MSERQKQHLGRSADDDTTLEGRDIRADTPPGVGGERVSADLEGAADASADARHIGELLETAEEPRAGEPDAGGERGARGGGAGRDE